MHHVNSYVFDLLFMIIFFYSIYGYSFIFVFVPMHWIIKAIFTVPVIIWLIFCLMSIDSINIIIFFIFVNRCCFSNNTSTMSITSEKI